MRKTCQWFVSNAERMSILSVNFFQHFAWNLCNIALWGPAKHPQSTFACVLLIARNEFGVKSYPNVSPLLASKQLHQQLGVTHSLIRHWHTKCLGCNEKTPNFMIWVDTNARRFLTVGNLTGEMWDLISTLAVGLGDIAQCHGDGSAFLRDSAARKNPGLTLYSRKPMMP